MKNSVRLFAAAMFFTAIASMSSSASTLLCSAGPTSTKTGNNSYQVLYTCAIPANTIAANHAIRVTSSVLASASTDFNTEVTLNGVVLLIGKSYSLDYWDLTIVNTGSTTGMAAGVTPTDALYSVPQIAASHAGVSGLSWASAQNLQVSFSTSSSYSVQGLTFTVEAI